MVFLRNLSIRFGMQYKRNKIGYKLRSNYNQQYIKER